MDHYKCNYTGSLLVSRATILSVLNTACVFRVANKRRLIKFSGVTDHVDLRAVLLESEAIDHIKTLRRKFQHSKAWIFYQFAPDVSNGMARLL